MTMNKEYFLILVTIALLISSIGLTCGADTLSTRPGVKLEPVAEGFTAPMEFISAGDGTGRMFLVEQTGLVKIVNADGSVQAEPFLDVRGRMVELMTRYDERGLLGLAFHPDFAENGRIFVFYSAPLRDGAAEGWNCTSHLSEFSVSLSDPNKVDMTSEMVLLQVDKPQFNHNGGTIAFGPDGYLYIPLGDGGNADDAGLGHAPDGNGQNTATFLGKILRIDVDRVDQGMAYGIPDDNPFLGQEGILPEIYALGLRNPWRISFDSDFSLFVSDAGQNLWEEVDIVASGGNYGWNIREGTHCFDVKNPDVSPANCSDRGAGGEMLIDPVIEYGHDLGTVVVGGYVYRGQALPQMQGKYIFADWSNDFAQGNGTLLAATPSSKGLWSWEEIEIAESPSGRVDSFIRSMGIDDDGEIYLLTSDELGPTGSTGKIFKIEAE
ncbi:MAG: PQQ-dependent sugar dehydrogenase [Methanotrichaceae archaeon]|nr:PQQ-dependent sugar dehydrogenase [Methanotrichaceae archaeon]